MAYGARLESVLGASPRGFESPILRHQSGTVRFRIFYALFTPAFPSPGLLPGLRSLPALLFLDDAGLRVKMCVWLGVSRGLDLAFLNAD